MRTLFVMCVTPVVIEVCIVFLKCYEYVFKEKTIFKDSILAWISPETNMRQGFDGKKFIWKE